MSRQTLSPSDLDDALAWREGLIIFRDTPLEEALARYARHHGVSIHAAPAVAREPVGGRFSIDDLKAFLDAIVSTLPVKVSTGSSGAVSVMPRAGS
jgi:transmembrane sensor